MKKVIAQSFENDYFIPTKADLHLRHSNLSSSSFELFFDTDVTIDACNFLELFQGENYLTIYDNQGTGYGVVASSGLTVDNITDAAMITFPLSSEEEGKYNIWVRVNNPTENVKLGFTLDNIPTYEIDQLATTWTWIKATVVLFDNQTHKLGISFLSKNTQLDRVFITRSNSTPSSTVYDSDYSQSPYLTNIVRLGKVVNNTPVYWNNLGYNTSLDIPTEGWYSFDISSLANEENEILNESNLCVSLFSAGGDYQNYTSWDLAKQYSNHILIREDSEWAVVNKSLALKIYSDLEVDEYNCVIHTPEAKIKTLNYDDLSKSSLKGKNRNTEYVTDSNNGKDVQLDLNDKLINILIDQSGSNTWNDNTNLRFSTVENVLDILDVKYPNVLNYNLIEFKGEPSFSFLIPLKNRITGSVSEIIREHFKDDSDHFSGFKLIRKKNSYSLSPIDGEIVLEGYALAALDIDLESSTDYYYTIFTYDYFGRFSVGIQIQTKTNELILPRGIPWFKGKVLLGYDLKLDDNVIALWQTDENEGDFSFDFSSNSNKLFLEKTNWISIQDAPTGVSGLRFNGINSKANTKSSTILNFELDEEFSILSWIFPLDTTLSEKVIFSNGTASNLNYAVILDNNILKLTFDGSSYYVCDTPIEGDKWTHIAITYNNGVCKFYLNGVLSSSTNGSFSSTYTGDNVFSIGYDLAGVSRFDNRFFGKISHISLHNVERQQAYITSASTPVKGEDDNGNPAPVDNGDRTVVVEFAVPDDYNYNTVRIVRNNYREPTHENDGTIVYESAVTPDKYFESLSYSYDVNETYYFKLFTKNIVNNWSPIEDSHGFDLLIPDVFRPEITNDITGDKSTEGAGINASLNAVNVIENRTGNEKVWFKWDNATLPATRVKVYYSTENFPYYDKETKSIEGAGIIFNGPTGQNEFVHRKLTNRQFGYYAIIPFDRLGRFADPSKWVLSRHFPMKELDDSGIPLLEALNVKYHLIDYDRIKITWESPVTITSSFDGWFDDRFFVYAAICDLYGNPLPINYSNNFNFTSSISNVEEFKTEDVFRLGLDTENVNSIPNIKFSINPDGLITGIVKLKSSPIFAIVNKLSINISGIYNYSDSFTYELQSTTINFNNPLSLKLINRDNLYLKTTDYISPSGCAVDDDSGGVGKENDPRRKQVNGVHIRRKNPFTIRAIYSYKNLPINGAKIACRIYDSAGGPCSIVPKNFLGNTSSTVITNSNVFASVKENSPILDGNGNPTGFSETISYSDIPVVAPFLPQDATAYIKCDANNYVTIKKMNLFFPGLLKINITPSSPDSNNIDIKEQFARAYLIDPDSPTDSSKFTNVPDGTIAKWELKQGTSIVRRIPFYSIDNVPLTTGVYSYFRSGSSRNIFIGPANPSSAGVYTLTVSTTARGLFGEASAQIEIKGNSGSEFEHFIPDPELPRILAEFPDTVNYIWTDGIDYQKMIISRDANRSTTKYKNKFIECSSGTLLPLPPGTVVNIQAKGYEILTGDVVELVDENGNKYLEDSAAIRNTDFAQITLSNELYSYVYFRRNEFITDAGCRDLQNNNCSAFDAPATICYDPYDIGQDLAVIVSAKINFAGKPLTIYGGGHFGNDGRPPCVLIPIEPLYVRYFGLFVNGRSVSDFAVDGTTIHHMYFQVKYKENNVPTGTPVEVFACNLNPTPPLEANETCRRINSNVGVPTFVYVYNTNQLPGDSTIYEETFSLIDIPIGPISSDNDIAVGIYPSINFINGNSVLIESSSSSSSSSV